MAKSSVDYAEQMGLMVALSNLELVDTKKRDEEWSAVVKWIKNRLKTLSEK